MTSPICRISQICRKLPLRLVLVVPFVLQSVAVVGLMGYFSVKNGQKAVNQLAKQWCDEIAARVEDKLHTYLDWPHQIDGINADAIRLGLLDAEDKLALGQQFWQQLQVFPLVDQIYFGDEGGGFILASRNKEAEAPFRLKRVEGSGNENLTIYAVDGEGKPQERLSVLPGLDPRKRPWYRMALNANSPTWSEIYPIFTDGTLAISASQPVYDGKGELLGVVATDLKLSQIGQFLQSLEIGKSGQIFIVESSGKLVATSEASIQPLSEDQPIQATESHVPLIRTTTEYLRQRFHHDLRQIDSQEPFKFQFDGERYFSIVTPLQDDRGIDWLIVVVVPESEFLGLIQENTRTTIVLCLVALGVAIVLDIPIDRWVTRAIARLSQASKDIARNAHHTKIRGELDRQLEVGGIRELVVLARSLRESFSALKENNEELERGVEQRTAEMRALFTAMTEFIFVKDAEGRYLQVASTDPEVLYKTDELVGKTEYDIFPKEKADGFVGYIRQALSTQQTVKVEYQLPVGDKAVWFSASISPILEGSSSTSTPRVIWVARDITDRKKAEEKLCESERDLRLILDNIPQQVFLKFLKDDKFVFRWCNQNWADSAQLKSPEDVEGKTDYDLLPEAVAKKFEEEDRRILETGQPKLHVRAIKHKPGPRGEKIWLDINKVPIYDAGGTAMGILGVLEDITARKLAEEALELEQEKSEQLLLNILPKPIAEQLKQTQNPKAKTGTIIAEQFEVATILFADIVGFTPLSAQMPATELVNWLNRIFSTFDHLAERYELEKIKTIGDAYMVAGGIPVPRKDHAEAIADIALDMQQAITCFQVDLGSSFNIRIGINTGPVVAGVIGLKKFSYDLWGDTVNVASRMESSGGAGKIQVSETTYQHLKHQYFFEERGIISVKGKGEMMTYWLIAKKVKTLKNINPA